MLGPATGDPLVGAVDGTAVGSPDLASRVRRGLGWSLTNAATLRLGTFLSSILFARLLAPEAFGVYAVALTVQAILINVSELGLTTDLVKHGDLRRRGPTVTTLSTVSGLLMFGLMYLTAPAVSTFMGAPQATSVVRLMSVIVLLGGMGAVPLARLQRDFAQGRMFAADATNFVVSTVVTVVLALAGLGVVALVIGRVAAQLSSTTLLFLLARQRLRFGWNRSVGVQALSFGGPLAAANLLSWVLLTVDNAIVGHWSGAVALGFYVLAFNVSSWPMSVIGMATRSVALPGFVRAQDGSIGAAELLSKAVLPTSVVALPVGALLAVLAAPLIEVLYGERWLAAASALTGLAVFGALRVVLDLFVSFLIAHGGTRAVLYIQVLWLGCLTPCMYLAVTSAGLAGAGWVHLVVAVVVTLPAYLVALGRHGVGTWQVLAGVLPGAGLGLLVGAAGWAGMQLAGSPLMQLIAGGAAGGVAFLAVVLAARTGDRFRRTN
jgi:PST family polysaccharide transporter